MNLIIRYIILTKLSQVSMNHSPFLARSAHQGEHYPICCYWVCRIKVNLYIVILSGKVKHQFISVNIENFVRLAYLSDKMENLFYI